MSGLSFSILLAAHSDAPTKGVCRSLPVVLSRRQGWGLRAICGTPAQRFILVLRRPIASRSFVPVSLSKAIIQRSSSSCSKHFCWILRILSIGIGCHSVTGNPSGINVPENAFWHPEPRPLIAWLIFSSDVVRDPFDGVAGHFMLNQAVTELGCVDS